MTVFKAIDILVKNGKKPILITTGVMKDFRGNNENIETIKSYIEKNDLKKNILLLGLIPYDEVLVLMRKCIAVINPSFFEGWSSTVEEAKSIGKRLIISDIAVHREQRPQNVVYFDPRDEVKLAEILEHDCDEQNHHISQVSYNVDFKQDLLKRSKAFSENYYNLVKSIIKIEHN